MTRKYKERSQLDFQKEFSTEEACAQHLRGLRWPDGFRCPRCGHTEAWFIKTRTILDCKLCRTKTSLTAGTIFHKKRTSLIKWYWLIYHMALDKVGVSISEMQRILELVDYKTAWLMAHKIRKVMTDRDAGYNLAGLIEMDDTFFGPKGHKTGRGSERKATVLCAVSLYRDHNGEEKPGFAHRDPKAAGKLLPRVHRVISNSKAVIRGAHRGVSEKHLQSYLSEICYRFNRRFWVRELFDRLIKACVST
jgi:hypothetical protein